MSFRSKLIFLLLIVAVVPVAFSGLLSIHTSQKEMTARIKEFQQKSASLVAETIDSFFLDAVHSLKLSTQLIPFEQFPAKDLPDALTIPYRQFDFVNIVALLDQEGNQLAEPAFEIQPKKAEALKNHESVTAEELGEFGRHIPLKTALSSGVAFGPVYFCRRTQTPRVAMAIAFPVKEGKSRWVMAVEISLRSIHDKIVAAAPAEGQAFIVDGEGRVVCHTIKALMKKRVSLAGISIVSAGLKDKSTFSRRYLAADGRENAGAFASIASLGWGLVIAQPVEVAFLAVHRIRNYAIFWACLSLLVAVLGGIVFARGVSRPVRELAEGSMEIAKGDFDKKIPVRSKDEIGRLAETFNHMAHELQQSFSTISEQLVEIREKNREIQTWNEELNERVKKRTRELREAQDQINRSQKMAAIGELGAGVAHEVNNPLTGIQGFAQMMLAKHKPDDPSYERLSAIIKEAGRIRSIVADLLQFSQGSGAHGRGKIDLNNTIEKALRMVEGQMKDQGIAIEKSLRSDLPQVYGNASALQQVFVHLITNAKNAMPTGGTLSLETEELEGGAVKLAVGDTGRGIPEANLPRIFDPFFTTKDEATGKGLGLSVAYRIVEEHEGVVRVDSEEGKGTTFTVVLPGAPKKLHLV